MAFALLPTMSLEAKERELQQHLQALVPNIVLRWQPVPGTEIAGFLLEEASASTPVPRESFSQVMDSPPFWSLLWPSGNLVCRFLAGNPELVRGRTCVDLGCGSGLVAVTCARAGAQVVAADIDPLSTRASRLNSLANDVNVRLTDFWHPEPCDTLILADFLYDDTNIPTLLEFRKVCQEIFVLDCRLEELDIESFQYLGSCVGVAVPDLDPHGEFGRLRCWYYGPRVEEWSRILSEK